MRNPKKIALVVGLFIVSFLFFIYLSFPYVVLKEAISSKVLLSTGLNLRMESLGPALPVGVSASGVDIYKGRSNHARFKNATIKLSLLQLLMGRMGFSIDVEDNKGGELETNIAFGVFDLLAGDLGLPSVIDLDANGFEFDDLAALGIKAAVDSGIGGALGGPLLEKLAVKGKILGSLSLRLNSKHPNLSTGEVKLNLGNSVLVLSDPTLNFPDQTFKTALIAAKVNAGSVVIDPTTRFLASDIELGIDGKVALKPQIANSDLSLKAFIQLKGMLADEYGSLIDSVMNGMGKNGTYNLQIGGSLGAPAVTSI